MYGIENNKENRDLKFVTKAADFYRKKLFDAAVNSRELIIDQ